MNSPMSVTRALWRAGGGEGDGEGGEAGAEVGSEDAMAPGKHAGGWVVHPRVVGMGDRG